MGLAAGRNFLTPRSNFEIDSTISCSTSYESPWSVLSKSTTMLTLWRHLVTSKGKSWIFTKNSTFLFSISGTLLLACECIRKLITIIPNNRGHGQRSRSKLGQVILLTKTLFSNNFDWINFKLGVKVAHGLPVSWLVLRANRWWPS
jgi:hypothetical protein